jgi:tetratricopeptide (TPR) repeat protein
MVKKYEGIQAGLDHLGEARTILEDLTTIEPSNRRFQGLLAQTEREIGAGLVSLKQNDEALAAFDRGLKILRELARLEPGEPSHQVALATLSNQKGVLLIFMNQPDEALETLRSTQLILERLVQADPSHPRLQLELSNVLKDLGDLVARTGDREAALKLHVRALAIRESLSTALPVSEGHRISISHSLLAIGKINARLGRKAEAIAAFRRSAALQESDRNSPNGLYNLATTRASLAQCLDGVDREIEADHAARTFRRAIEAGFRDLAAMRSNLQNRPLLHSNREIQFLLMDLEFPENPFSRRSAAPVSVRSRRD